MILPREQAEEILALRDHGMTVRAIARKVGCAQNTVVGYINGRRTPGHRASRQHTLNDFADYCRQRLTDDPDLSTSALFCELTALGYAGSRPTFYRDLGRYHLLHLPSENAHLRESQQSPTMSTAIAAGPLRPLPVRVSPIAGEPLTSYLARVAASNHIKVDDMLTVLPEWICRRVAKHDDRSRRHEHPSATNSTLRQLALITGVTQAALTHALPALTTAFPGNQPMGPMRITTACRRCTAARGIHHPLPVHLPSHAQVCVRHGIWLSSSNRHQLDVNICPEIVTTQKRAWRLLRRFTPEQLMFARVTATQLIQADPPPSWHRRLQLLHAANPGITETITEQELTNAATYPDAIDLWRSPNHTRLIKIH
ncbi:MAG: TniQ family protein [Pseudonocardiales bacterium]|nr:TniQ family protein [Pseudonocardiales bacterium]MBV9730054.1 TniQ family protein [Pseudonocardiales bacterium]